MELSITIGGPLADAINNLAAALHTVGAIEKAQAMPAKTEKPAKTEPVAPVKTEVPGASDATVPEAAAQTTEVPSIAELRAAADAVVEKHGVKPVKTYLTDLGVAKLADMPEDRRADALATLRGML